MNGEKTEGVGWKRMEGRRGGWTALQGGGGGGRRGGQARDAVPQGNEAGEGRRGRVRRKTEAGGDAGGGWLSVDRRRNWQGGWVVVVVGWARTAGAGRNWTSKGLRSGMWQRSACLGRENHDAMHEEGR